MLPRNRPPTPPGEILADEFLSAKRMTQGDLAEKMGVSVQTVNMVVNSRRSVAAESAILLSKVLGTTPEFWMNLQAACDLWQAERRLRRSAR